MSVDLKNITNLTKQPKPKNVTLKNEAKRKKSRNRKLYRKSWKLLSINTRKKAVPRTALKTCLLFTTSKAIKQTSLCLLFTTSKAVQFGVVIESMHTTFSLNCIGVV